MTDHYDLGSHRRKVSTTSPEAQRWFDRGLVWCYGYNHEEAVRCFENAAEADPACAMAHWGIAYAAGPNYNKQWQAFDRVDLQRSLDRAFMATRNAMARRDAATPVERALIGTLPACYPASFPNLVNAAWNDDYAHAMREVYRAHRDDHDVAALFAEAIMNRTPWLLWDVRAGTPAQGADTLEAIEVLECAMAQPGGTRHPGLLHMYMHLMEMGPHPERALPAADDLRDLVPDAGHLIHMPTHIDMLCGRYTKVVEYNTRAIDADRKFLAREGARNFYTLYRCHNLHFKIYGAMFLGQFAPAREAADEIIESLTEDLLRVEVPPLADWLEGFVSVKMHVLIRFGKWHDIIAETHREDRSLFCVTTAMTHYAKAVAHAALGDPSAAEREAMLFHAAVAAVPASRCLFNNTCLDILAIAGAMMQGEIAYRQGDFDTAFSYLRKSVALDDGLPYDEPWGWMQPTRHALGALLLEQGRVDEAEAVYRADLGLDPTLPRCCQHPGNVWALHGLHECLVRRGETGEAARIGQQLEAMVAGADVPIRSSCFCRSGKAA